MSGMDFNWTTKMIGALLTLTMFTLSVTSMVEAGSKKPQDTPQFIFATIFLFMAIFLAIKTKDAFM